MVAKRRSSYVSQTHQCSDHDIDKSKTFVERKLSENPGSILRLKIRNQRLVGQQGPNQK